MNTPTVIVPYWSELFVELVLTLYSIATVIFVDQNATGRGTTLYVSEHVSNSLRTLPLCMLLKLEQNYYPLAHIQPQVWFSTHQAEFIYGPQTVTSAQIREMMELSGEVNTSTHTYTQKYVNMHNLVYGRDIMYEGNVVYVPQDYTPNVTDGVPSTFSVPTGGQIDHLLAWASKHGIVFDGTIEHNGLTIALKTGHLVWHVQPHAHTHAYTHDLPKQVLNFDIKDVNRAIMEHDPPSGAHYAKLGNAMYATLQYQLLLIEFVAFIDRERNLSLRKQLIADKKAINDPAISETDRALLIQQRNDSKTFQASLQANTYDFDRLTILEFPTAQDKKAFIRKRIDEIAVQGTPTVSTFPNIYLPCAETSHEYCQGKRLILQDIDAMADILAADLDNPLKRTYLLNNIWMENNVNALEFTRRVDEIVTVYKL